MESSCWRAWQTGYRKLVPVLPILVAIGCGALVLGVLTGTAAKYVTSKNSVPLAMWWDGQHNTSFGWSTTLPSNVTELVVMHHRADSNYTAPDLVVVSCTFSDLQKFWQHTAELTCSLLLFGAYGDPHWYGRARLDPNTTLVWQINDVVKQLNNGNGTEAMVVPVRLGIQDYAGKNTLVNYPHSKLPFELFVSVALLDERGVVAGDQPGVLFELLHGYNAMFYFDPLRAQAEPYLHQSTVLVVHAQLMMDGVSVALLYALLVVMWVVTAATVLATLVWCWSPVVGEEHGTHDLLAFSGALLFALPTMRQLWPLAPPGGTLFDIFGIYAQLLCIGVSIFAQLVRRMVTDWAGLHKGTRNKPDKQADTGPALLS